VSSIEIAKQLVRCAGSAPANIAEGHGRFSAGAFRNHLLIARGSLAETGSFLDLLCRCEYIDVDTEARLSGDTFALMGKLSAKARSLEKQLTPARIRDEASSDIAASHVHATELAVFDD
jgi:four helix bundle protein